MKSFLDNEPRRYLIAIGSPYCPNIMGGSELPRVDYDINQVDRLFTSKDQGYERALPELDLGETSQNIKQALSSWFSSPDRKATDCVVVYYAGHGEDVDNIVGNHYLYTIESKKHNLASTAIKTSDLVTWFFPGKTRGESPQNILLILDTCYAGSGREQISGALAGFNTKKNGGSGLWIISSADSNSVAGDGTFVEALQAVMSPEHRIFQENSDFIPIESLGSAINEYLESQGETQRAEWDSSGGREKTKFIRNSRLINLANSIPNIDRLLALLDQIEDERLYEAYRRCYPGWASHEPFPKSPNTLLSVLINSPNGKEKLLPALIGVLRQDKSIADDLRESLQEWGSSDRLPDDLIPLAVQTESCLMVYVSETKRRYHYAVSAALVEGIDPEKKTEECRSTPLKFPEKEEEALTEKQISEQISKVVAGLVCDLYDRELPLKQLSVQCFLPRKFLNIPIEQEVIEIIETSPVIGTVCKTVLFRSSERQSKRQKPEGIDRLQAVQRQSFVDGNWRERWSVLRSNFGANCRDILVLHQGDDDHFYEALEDDTKIGCGFVGFLDSSATEKLFGEIFVGGIPVAIWLRSDHTSDDPYAALESILAESTIGELPQLLTRKRKSARRNAASAQNNMAQHVALLWDNPLHSFPSIDYLKT
jgi:vWA-MoxR associated protein C-terminal domain/Caspase domain/vWA-MoxR associated protein middle region (VMAP-M) 1